MEISTQIICIGNEIMLGHIANTNAQYLSKKLSDIGIKTSRHMSIPDKNDTIVSSIKTALKKSSIVILTGGLGPTVDDLTLRCISKALNRKLIFKNHIANHIKAHFRKRRLKMPANNLRQALVPEGAIPILNDIGTAPGLLITVRGKILVALPGVPFELYPMFEKSVANRLKKLFHPQGIIKSRIIKITGLSESRVNEKIKDLLKGGENIQMGIYPHPEEISVKITVTGENKKRVNAAIKKVEKNIASRLGKDIFGYDTDTLEGIAAKKLLKTKKSLSVAESCTGGLLSDRITNIPGSSRYFKMGVVVYSNVSKNKILNVSPETIKKYGAVSKKVAALMSKNVRRLGASDIGIGITGIAGPGGAARKKPIGLVYIALSTRKKTISKEFRFLGQRKIIKHKATQTALNMLRLELK